MIDRMTRRARWIVVPALAGLAACAAPGDSQKPATAPGLDTGPGAVAAPAAAGQLVAGAAANLDANRIAAGVRRYFESEGELPPDVTIGVADFKPSQIAGLTQGTMKISKGDKSQDIPFLISGDGRWFLRVDPIDLTVDPLVAVREKLKVGPDDPVRGPKDSPVTIVEFSDFQCPFCAKAETILEEEVLKTYGDKVRFVYKHYPLKQMHEWAEAASLTGICLLRTAGNDAYWKYHSSVFKNASSITPESANERLASIAKEAGGDPAKIKECLDSGQAKAILDATLAQAEELGVNSTPMFFVNGRKLSGAQGLEAFKALIDPALEKKS